MANNASLEERALKLLSNALDRPKPSEVKDLDFNNIDRAAEKLGYPVFPLDKYILLHEMALHLLENKITWLLSLHEEQRPKYITIGRDAEMIYDAMESIGNLSLSGRVNLVTMSSLHYGVKINRSNDISYLRQEGLSTEALRAGQNFVIIDTGFMGTMISALATLVGYPDGRSPGKISGYLVWSHPDSKYPSLGWSEDPKNEEFFEEFYKKFAKLWESSIPRQGRPIMEKMLASPDTPEKVSWALSQFMQVSPKYSEQSYVVENIGGLWRPRPKEDQRAYPAQGVYRDVVNVTKPVLGMNECTVDPVAALKLQVLTINYFSPIDVQNRILSNLKKKN